MELQLQLHGSALPVTLLSAPPPHAMHTTHTQHNTHRRKEKEQNNTHEEGTQEDTVGTEENRGSSSPLTAVDAPD